MADRITALEGLLARVRKNVELPRSAREDVPPQEALSTSVSVEVSQVLNVASRPAIVSRTSRPPPLRASEPAPSAVSLPRLAPVDEFARPIEPSFGRRSLTSSYEDEDTVVKPLDVAAVLASRRSEPPSAPIGPPSSAKAAGSIDEALRIAREQSAVEAAREEAERRQAELDLLEAEAFERELVLTEQQRAERAAAENAEAERLAVEKALAERVEAERLAVEQALAERAAAERRAVEKAEAERLAIEKDVAERLAVERARAEEAAAAVVAAEAERVAVEKALAETAEAEKAEAERVAVEKALAETAEAEKAEVERVAAREIAPVSTRQPRPKDAERGPADFAEMLGDEEEEAPASGEVASQRVPTQQPIRERSPWADEAAEADSRPLVAADGSERHSARPGPPIEVAEPAVRLLVEAPVELSAEVVRRVTLHGDAARFVGEVRGYRPTSFGELLDASLALRAPDAE